MDPETYKPNPSILDFYRFALKFNLEIEQDELGPNIYQITAYCAGEPMVRALLAPQGVNALDVIIYGKQ